MRRISEILDKPFGDELLSRADAVRLLTAPSQAMTPQAMVEAIRSAGRTALRRDTLYNVLRSAKKSPAARHDSL